MNVDRNIDKLILNVLKEAENPVSTREIALKTGKAWNTVINHCLRLSMDKKIEEIKMSNINFWRIKK